MQGFRRVLAGLAIAATLATGTACSPMGDIVGADHDEASHSQVPETSAPYCMVDRDLPAYLTVAGPADGRITVNGVSAGTLVLVDAIDYGPEVAPDAGPYNGILYNVEGPGTVRVNGHECETT